MIEPTELSPLNWACDVTLENYFFQIQTNSREGSITWFEAGQQTNKAKEVYCVKKKNSISFKVQTKTNSSLNIVVVVYFLVK